MRLAPIIERYMSLKRQQIALYNDFDLVRRNTPVSTEEYSELLTLFHASFYLLHETRHFSFFQMNLTAMEQYGAELAAVDEVMAEIAKKTQETRTKSTCSARSE